MLQNLCILGSTGSIGQQALLVAESLNINIRALTANRNITLLEQQIRKFKPDIAVVFDEACAKNLKQSISDLPTKVLCGMSGLCEAASDSNSDAVLNSLVGMVGLLPTISAIESQKTIALANKETLVTGGDLIIKAAKENQVDIIPIDSEHSAIFQCLQALDFKDELKSIILTASGGPFLGKSKEDLKNVTLADALNHPNWSMGAKITVDSATMMNKGLEIIEAKWLFDTDNITVVVHPESIVHSLVEFKDNSVIAQLGLPDMRLPIQYALTYPHRVKSQVPALNLVDVQKLTFYSPDENTFSCMKACKDAMRIGGTMPTIVNAANEVAVSQFISGNIQFLDIPSLVFKAMGVVKSHPIQKLEDIIQADKESREFVYSILN